MKKTINQKRYNTETAELVAEFSEGYASDFNYVRERLYRTKKGNWFLHGKGGANSGYAERHNGWSCEGEDIVAFSESDAYNWLEENNKNEAIDKYFSDLIEEA